MPTLFSRAAARLVSVTAIVSCVAAAPSAQATKETLAGVSNFARVETTVACGGATRPEALADIRRLGFVSVINLRLSTEPGADIDVEAAAAQAAGLKFIHLPLSGSSPDPAVVDQFLKALDEPGVQPAFIHCASGNRAAALWMIKRVEVDGWDRDRAATEAASLGLTSSPLKQFVTDYLSAHPASATGR